MITDARLAEIRTRAARHTRPHDKPPTTAPADFADLCTLLDQDVPALLAEVERLHSRPEAPEHLRDRVAEALYQWALHHTTGGRAVLVGDSDLVLRENSRARADAVMAALAAPALPSQLLERARHDVARLESHGDTAEAATMRELADRLVEADAHRAVLDKDVAALRQQVERGAEGRIAFLEQELALRTNAFARAELAAQKAEARVRELEAELQRVEVYRGMAKNAGDAWRQSSEAFEAERDALAAAVQRVRKVIADARLQNKQLINRANQVRAVGEKTKAGRHQRVASEITTWADRFEKALDGTEGS
jgi:hypothetical protein